MPLIRLEYCRQSKFEFYYHTLVGTNLTIATRDIINLFPHTGRNLLNTEFELAI